MFKDEIENLRDTIVHAIGAGAVVLTQMVAKGSELVIGLLEELEEDEES